MNARTRRALNDIRTYYSSPLYPSSATRLWEWLWALDDVLGHNPRDREIPDYLCNGNMTCYDDSPYAKGRD